VHNIEVQDVQADEIWGFVAMKEKTKTRKGITDDKIGDAYTFVAMERSSKLALAWHLGRRTEEDTKEFIGKLHTATAGGFQLTTDGYNAYPEAVESHFGKNIDFAQLIKQYGKWCVNEEERRYSPPSVISVEKIAISGDPVEEEICTSHIERQNLHMRMSMRRLTRLTNAFSKKWENLKAALALHFWNYNFCWMHRTIRMTPAMRAGISRKPLRVLDLIEA
jgi:IS1 family transposase